jgi:hypothetical protein
MNVHVIRRVFGASVVAAAGVVGLGAMAASASPVPSSQFTCGVTVFTACNQTAHFSDPSGGNGPEVGSPSPQATGCPAWIRTDAPVITGTGNGVEHSIVNKNGDGWFTSTFTGDVQVVPYTVDQSGNPVAPDPNAPTYTGHLTQWFGGSFNNKNYVNHDTISFVGTGSDGSTISFHAVDHMSTSATAQPAPNTFDIAHC